MSDTAADVDIYGDQTLGFGLPEEVKTLVAGMAITELSDDAEPQWTAEAVGPDADMAAFAVSKKQKFSGTGSGYVLDVEDWMGVKTFQFEGRTYIILKRSRPLKYNEFQKGTFTYIGYEGITAQA